VKTATNITPLTPERSPLPYTIVGGQGMGGNPRSLLPFSVMVLHRNNSYDREQIFDRLHRLNVQQVLSVETGVPRYDIEAYAGAYKEFRFMLLPEAPASVGELINLAMQEVHSSLVLVMWSDTIVLPVSRAYLDEYEAALDLCIMPYCRSADTTLLPTLYAPGSFGKTFQILDLPPGPDRRASLFPFQYMGLYRRETFLQSGGFDSQIISPWWQKVDFGLRARLWGYTMHVSPGLRLQITEEVRGEDTSFKQGYQRFYGKNLLPEFRADHAALPLRRFAHFQRASSASLFDTWKEFRVLAAWVHQHQYRFKTEAKSIVEFWEREDELYQ
jgi:hypothetical protein